MASGLGLLTWPVSSSGWAALVHLDQGPVIVWVPTAGLLICGPEMVTPVSSTTMVLLPTPSMMRRVATREISGAARDSACPAEAEHRVAADKLKSAATEAKVSDLRALVACEPVLTRSVL